MAKDPAFLFYPNDYLGGTTGMTLEEKGGYMELLVMQFNKGAFTKDQARKLLNGHFEELWLVLSEKFTELNGKYFNKRLEEEKQKRNFTAQKNKDRIQAYWDKKKESENTAGNSNVYTECLTKSVQYENEIENEIENINVLEDLTQKNLLHFPTHETYKEPLTEIQIGSVQQLYKLTKQYDLTADQVNNFFNIFKVQNLNGKKFYADVGEVYSHFLNWIKTQNISNGTTKSNTGNNGKPATGADKLTAKLKSNIEAFSAGRESYPPG